MGKLGVTVIVLAKTKKKICPIASTVEIAKKVGATVYKRKLDDFCSQRNFALAKVKTPWVFFIDAE